MESIDVQRENEQCVMAKPERTANTLLTFRACFKNGRRAKGDLEFSGLKGHVGAWERNFHGI
jgi:hypothetical protein